MLDCLESMDKDKLVAREENESGDVTYFANLNYGVEKSPTNM